ncbi:MAG: acetyl-CoA carboxylase biotin carboxyl carrier protein [Pseudonocardiaceae bacterium]
MSDDIPGATGEELRALCQQAIALVKSLPGPMRRVSVRTADRAVELEWPIGDTAPVPVAVTEPSAPGSQMHAAVPDDTPAAGVDVVADVIRAPLVGIFYRGPEPGADPLVSVGDVVEVGQTVAIVEAMKLLNHIVSEVAGRVVEICVHNGAAVEFAQPLMRILPLVDDRAG